jgi:hypothetical protein
MAHVYCKDTYCIHFDKDAGMCNLKITHIGYDGQCEDCKDIF